VAQRCRGISLHCSTAVIAWYTIVVWWHSDVEAVPFIVRPPSLRMLARRIFLVTCGPLDTSVQLWPCSDSVLLTLLLKLKTVSSVSSVSAELFLLISSFFSFPKQLSSQSRICVIPDLCISSCPPYPCVCVHPDLGQSCQPYP
jgi:hypothetical protein